MNETSPRPFLLLLSVNYYPHLQKILTRSKATKKGIRLFVKYVLFLFQTPVRLSWPSYPA